MTKSKKALKKGVADTAIKAVDGGEHEKSIDETQGKNVLSTGAHTVKSVITAPVKFSRFRTKRKFKKFDKAERKAIRANTKLETKTLRFAEKAEQKVNPSSKSSNPLSRAFQKKRIRKDYRKRLKERSKQVAKSIGTNFAQGVASIKKHFRKIGMVAVVIFMFINFISSCGTVVTQGFMSLLSGTTYASFTADEGEIEQADWYFSELELQLDEKIDKAEENNPNYDEYRYFLNGSLSSKEAQMEAISHDPFSLIAYLTVMFDDFVFVDIQSHIYTIFNEIFVFETVEEIEIRTRTAYDEDGNSYQEEYEYKILNIKLTVNDFETVATPYMNGTKERADEHYDTLIDTEGNHQSYGSPLNYNWRDSIRSLYGGRDNPTGANTGETTPSGKEMHTGLDIAAPLGTPIYSVMEGKVTFAGWHDLYGNYVDVTDKNGNKSRYAHCSRLLVTVGQDVKRGQAIAEVGSTGNSTGPHLHIEIFQNGQHINPLFVIAREPKTREESEE